jgi:hypothetical protein
MNAVVIRRLEMLEAVDQFGTDHPLAPPSARATVLYGQIETLIATLNGRAADQQAGAGDFFGGTAQRRALAEEVILTLREISKTGKALPEDQFPGAGAQFHVTSSKAYAAVRANLEAFIEALTPIKAAFVERGYPATIDEDLAALLTTLDAASLRRQGGRLQQRLGTVALKNLSRDGMAMVKELSTIVSRQLRKTNPELLEVWKTTSRMRRAPRSEEEPEQAIQPAAPSPAPAPTP